VYRIRITFDEWWLLETKKDTYFGTKIYHNYCDAIMRQQSNVDIQTVVVDRSQSASYCPVANLNTLISIDKDTI